MGPEWRVTPTSKRVKDKRVIPPNRDETVNSGWDETLKKEENQIFVQV